MPLRYQCSLRTFVFFYPPLLVEMAPRQSFCLMHLSLDGEIVINLHWRNRCQWQPLPVNETSRVFPVEKYLNRHRAQRGVHAGRTANTLIAHRGTWSRAGLAAKTGLQFIAHFAGKSPLFMHRYAKRYPAPVAGIKLLELICHFILADGQVTKYRTLQKPTTVHLPSAVNLLMP